MINIGVIGFGYWGPNVARNINGCKGAKLVSISDINENRRNLAVSNYPAVKGFLKPEELIASGEVDAVAIVTPVYTHYDLAKFALNHDKHIFIEKPFTSNSAQAGELTELAHKRNLKIMVDHTFLFTGAVKKMKEVIDSKELGSLFFYDSVRVNLGLFQHDINVLWDLAPHDFSIMNYLMSKKPTSISAFGKDHLIRGLEDVVYVTVQFEDDDGLLAHFHCNWLSPVKVRRTLISGDKKMLIWDDLSPDEKIKIYDRGVEFNNGENIHKLLVSYRSGDMYVPKIDNAEALKLEIEYFLECLNTNQEPFNNGEAGFNVVRMLEAADQSLKNEGKKVIL
jgi:predicted dehydrogenase